MFDTIIRILEQSLKENKIKLYNKGCLSPLYVTEIWTIPENEKNRKKLGNRNPEISPESII